MKKILLLILTLCLCAPNMRGQQFDGYFGTDLLWQFNQTTGVLTISGDGDMPDFINFSDAPWYDYTGVHNETFDRALITTVEIRSGVTSIGKNAFNDLTGLTGVTWGSVTDVTRIGANAFEGCNHLEDITIPRGVTEIGKDAFDGCIKLATVHFNADNCITKDAPGWTEMTTLVIGATVKSIPANAFKNCTQLKTTTPLVIGSSVETIGDDAFSGCSGINNVTIGDNVTSIGARAFQYCTGLTVVTLGTRVTTIAEAAFSGCSKLESVSFPSSVTDIKDEAFDGCSKLAKIEFSTLTYVKTIGAKAFRNCSSTGLTTLTIPNSVTEIGVSAFEGCNHLLEVTIGEGVKTIGEKAFSGCIRLNKVNFNATVCGTMSKTLPAFAGCTALATVEIGDNVTQIPNNAFYQCSGLSTVHLGAEVGTIGEYAFSESGLTSISTQGSSVATINEGAFKDCKQLASITLSGSVETIGKYAFSGCTSSNLTTLTIPSGVRTISQQAFDGCTRLTTLTIGADVKTIGAWAFQNCTRLSTVNFNATDCNDMSSTFAFTGCGALATVNIGNNVRRVPAHVFNGGSANLTTVTIGNSVETIGESAFNGCNKLATLTIGESVETIESAAFNGCNKLASVTFPGSVTEIENYAFAGCEALTEIHSQNPAPPTIYTNTFQGINLAICRVYVPQVAVTDYREAPGWQDLLYINGEAVPVKDIFISSEKLILERGDTMRLIAYGLPVYADNTKVTWSPGAPSIATVSTDGLVTAKSVGEADIIATTQAGPYSARCHVTVLDNITAVPVRSITLSEPTVTLPLGSTYRLVFVIEPQTATNKDLQWEVNADGAGVVSVTDGVVTPRSAGTATITALSADGTVKSNACAVTVTTPVKSVTLPATLTLSLGGTPGRLTADIEPSTATNKAVTWAVNAAGEEIVKVENGVVTALAAGEAAITAISANGIESNACAVTVTTPVKSVTLPPTLLLPPDGEPYPLTDDIEIEPETATNKEVTWKVSPLGVVSVEDGLVTPLASGTAVITATADGIKSNDCAVTVTTPVDSVTLYPTTLVLQAGGTLPLTAIVWPLTATTNKAVKWEIIPPTGTVRVDCDGLDAMVTGIAAGAAKVIVYSAEDENKTATCEITVEAAVTPEQPVSVERVSFPNSQYIVEQGKTFTLVATITPDNADNKNVTWESANTTVAEVNAITGAVTAKAAGTAVITATSVADGNKKGTCEIEVLGKVFTKDSTQYNIKDSTVYNLIPKDSIVYDITEIDSTVYNITEKDTTVYNITVIDSIVYNIITEDSIDYTLVPDTVYVVTDITGVNHIVTATALVIEAGDGILIQGLEPNAEFSVYTITGVQYYAGTANSVGEYWLSYIDEGLYILFFRDGDGKGQFSKFHHRKQ